MKKLPNGCQARYAEIVKRAAELSEAFFNGNKNFVANELHSMGTYVALAVLAEMFITNPVLRQDLHKYFMEVA
jgi:hypothetical protein